MATPDPTQPTRVSDSLMQALAVSGVTRLFALSGNQIMPLFDACLETDIEIVHTRHEAACVYMAEAHAQLTGELGVALVTAGAGLGNSVGALYCAAESETPVLLLSGDSPCNQDGTGAFQEMPQVAMTAPFTRYSARPTSAAEAIDALSHACAAAAGAHPGPAHLALPADLLTEPAAPTALPTLPTRTQPGVADAAVLDALQTALAGAARPLILLGPALNATRQPALHPALATATGAAVAVLESPRGLRDPAYSNLRAPLEQADLIVLLGKRCDYTLGFGSATDASCRWLVVDSVAAHREQAERNLAGHLVEWLHADPTAVACALATRTSQPKQTTAWHSDCATALAPLASEQPASTATALHPGTVCEAVQVAIDAAHHPILICDGGEFGQWAQAVCHAPRRVINGVAGSIGGGIPQAIAASLAFPDAEVFVLMGDGSAGFHIAEFDTAVRHGARFTAIIGNDRRWNAEHQIQLRSFGEERTHSCSLGDAAYDAIARACGARGERITSRPELDQLLQARHELPLCVDVSLAGAAAPEPSPARPGNP